MDYDFPTVTAGMEKSDFIYTTPTVFLLLTEGLQTHKSNKLE